MTTLAIHPIDDKDSQSAKDKGELSERHLWESVKLRSLCQLIISYLEYPSNSSNVGWLGVVLGRYNIIRKMNLESYLLSMQSNSNVRKGKA